MREIRLGFLAATCKRSSDFLAASGETSSGDTNYDIYIYIHTYIIVITITNIIYIYIYIYHYTTSLRKARGEALRDSQPSRGVPSMLWGVNQLDWRVEHLGDSG